MASITETNSVTTTGTLQFDNRFTQELPADPNTENRRRQVVGACYSRVQPRQFEAPGMVAYSPEVAELLDFTDEYCKSEEFVQTFVGNSLLRDMDPYATCYGGHQFGNWAGQLGDGRAINLGEIINRKGDRWALQLKGAGPTPYARMADGLAVLRSSIREFLCSEAMHYLGIPTTRALSIVTTGEPVERDMFYDGNPKDEPGAVVCRVAPSFTRFGHFQIFTSRGDMDVLRQLANYTICTDYPHLGVHSATEITEDIYTAWFDEVCRRTAEMIVHWQRVGFVHGVMNTDNMSILGLTIDYGPYGWLEDYDPNWTPNTTDANGRRYRFAHQPQIALWNLVQFARAIYPLVGKVEPLENSLENYQKHFEQSWRSMMALKLGFENYEPDTDDALYKELDSILQMVETDMTIFYRKLASIEFNSTQKSDGEKWSTQLEEAYYLPAQLSDDYEARLNKWFSDYRKRLQRDGTSTERRRERMDAVNPKYVLRNYLAQLAIDKAEQGDHAMVGELLDLLRRPYDEQLDKEEYARKRPEWARHRAGCSMLSCSS